MGATIGHPGPHHGSLQGNAQPFTERATPTSHRFKQLQSVELFNYKLGDPVVWLTTNINGLNWNEQKILNLIKSLSALSWV